jgi:lysophospholipase L1-like esterase
MEAGFESSPERFIDMCHLSAEGSRRFVEQLWPHVEPIVDAYLSERR